MPWQHTSCAQPSPEYRIRWALSSERNKHPILEQLQRLLAPDATVLEIGSGWGQHAVFFCRHMPGWHWQPSERNEALAVLRQRVTAEGSGGIRPPLQLDVLSDSWPDGQYDAVFSANTAHIMSWNAVCAMFRGVSGCLGRNGLFCLYGPFNLGGRFTAPSNQAFDIELRRRDEQMGLRDMEALERLASGHQMYLRERCVMPANNFLLVFEKRQGLKRINEPSE